MALQSVKNHLRPVEIFDAHNKQHREWVITFMRTGSWRHCPVKFEVKALSIDTCNTMFRQLLEHYSSNEFPERG